jgi:hypothetical protein
MASGAACWRPRKLLACRLRRQIRRQHAAYRSGNPRGARIVALFDSARHVAPLGRDILGPFLQRPARFVRPAGPLAKRFTRIGEIALAPPRRHCLAS